MTKHKKTENVILTHQGRQDNVKFFADFVWDSVNITISTPY